jgi:hypothetical protein
MWVEISEESELPVLMVRIRDGVHGSKASRLAPDFII